MITGEQIRRGRELLGWTRYRLAPRAGMGHTLLAQFENCVRPLDEESASRLRAALEDEGVEFLFNGSGEAVRLRAHNGASIEVNHAAQGEGEGREAEVITGAQIRQARKLLGWSVKELGRRAKLAASTVHRAECVDGEPPITEAHAAVLRHVLERRGVEFTNGDEPGVKLKGKPGRPK